MRLRQSHSRHERQLQSKTHSFLYSQALIISFDWRATQQIGEVTMIATQAVIDAGQSIWLENLSRELLDSGLLEEYIERMSVTGLMPDVATYEQGIRSDAAYEPELRDGFRHSPEELLFDLLLTDTTDAADMVRPIHRTTSGVDGWVSLEVSPLLTGDAIATLAMARQLHARIARPNVFIKIPGSAQNLPAIEEAIFAGIPVNITLIFTEEQYCAAVNAWLRGIERRMRVGLNADVASISSLCVGQWDAAIASQVPSWLSNKLGMAVAGDVYRAYSQMISSPRWQRAYCGGARPQRLVFANTTPEDPVLSDTRYVEGLVAPMTISTMSEQTLKAFADHGHVGPALVPAGGLAASTLTAFRSAGIEVATLGNRLQEQSVAHAIDSWNDLLHTVGKKAQSLKKMAQRVCVQAD
jgi:transaldolase